MIFKNGISKEQIAAIMDLKNHDGFLPMVFALHITNNHQYADTSIYMVKILEVVINRVTVDTKTNEWIPETNNPLVTSETPVYFTKKEAEDALRNTCVFYHANSELELVGWNISESELKVAPLKTVPTSFLYNETLSKYEYFKSYLIEARLKTLRLHRDDFIADLDCLISKCDDYIKNVKLGD